MSYYKATQLIRTIARETTLITTVSHGSLNDIDVKRQTLFPLLHVVPVNFSNIGATVTYSFTLYFCDLIDFNKKDQYKQKEPWWNTDNSIDVLHQMSMAAQMFIDKINRGDSYNLDFRIEETNTGTFFTNRVENLLTGVQLEFSVTMPNTSVTDGIC